MLLFFINHKSISLNLHKTFWHEFGHVFNALTNGYKFTIIVLNDKEKMIHHLFYLQKGSSTKIKYAQMKCSRYDKLIIPSKGIALYYNDAPDKTEVVALGGFMQDFIGNKKTKREILSSMGINYFTLSPKKHTDSFYILNNSYSQKNNLKWKKIDYYLYHSQKINPHRYLHYPLFKYQKILNKN